MRIRTFLLAVTACIAFGSPAFAAGDLSGMWELQAIGQDGTSIMVDNTGDVLTLYRVMYPEFEGQKYKLEHLYTGRVIGNRVSGSLFVRDDPKSQFESLRPFDGNIQSDTYMIIDDLPLKQVRAGKQQIPVQAPAGKKKKGRRGGEGPAA
jgi:hypothetical protein